MLLFSLYKTLVSAAPMPAGSAADIKKRPLAPSQPTIGNIIIAPLLHLDYFLNI